MYTQLSCAAAGLIVDRTQGCIYTLDRTAGHDNTIYMEYQQEYLWVVRSAGLRLIQLTINPQQSCNEVTIALLWYWSKNHFRRRSNSIRLSWMARSRLTRLKAQCASS